MTTFFITPMRFAAIHYAFAFTVGFLAYSGGFRPFQRMETDRPSLVDLAMIAAALFVFGYVIVDYDNIINRVARPTLTDEILTVVLFVLVIDLTRRTIGWSIPIIALAMIAYTYAGNFVPGPFHHRGYGLERIASAELLSLSGVFAGSGITTIATIVFTFMVLAAVLTEAGGADFLRDVSIALAGRWRGGAAKIAVISSALFGSVQGSSISNVVTTGTFTIPLMKRTGFSPHYAGAVEAAASSGGQILPPIMGASAFLLAEFTGIPYSQVAVAATIPAILYFVSIFAQIHLYAGAHQIRAVTDAGEAVPRLSRTLITGWPFLPPFALLVWLISIRYPIDLSALYTVACLIVLTLISGKLSAKGALKATSGAFREMVRISAAVACSGIVVGLLNLTGMGIKLGYLIIDAAQGNLWLALVITMLVTLVLGIGLPTIGAYVIAASVAAPALIEVGLPPLHAHLFILYFAAVSSITPPVAICAYTAAAIAGAPPFKTGWLAFRLALVAYVVPFVFVSSPSLLMQGDTINIVWNTTTAVLGIFAVAAAIAGFTYTHANWPERALLAVGGALMFEPSAIGNWVGLGLSSAALGLQFLRLRNAAPDGPDLAADSDGRLGEPSNPRSS